MLRDSGAGGHAKYRESIYAVCHRNNIGTRGHFDSTFLAEDLAYLDANNGQ